jgi:hypothetical protein
VSHSKFPGDSERELIRLGVEKGNYKVACYVPNVFSQLHLIKGTNRQTQPENALVSRREEVDDFVCFFEVIERHAALRVGWNLKPTASSRPVLVQCRRSRANAAGAVSTARPQEGTQLASGMA